MLKFCDLQESLRQLLWERIESGELTEKGLAGETGFRQAHISNFLNRKRKLSLDAMDRVLAAEDLSILDLVPADEINQRAAIPPQQEGDYANLLVVDPAHAASPEVLAKDVLEVSKLKHALLRRMRTRSNGDRLSWQRFVMMRPTPADCEAMYPRLVPRCTVLIDRHYNSLVPYRRGERTLYAVQKEEQATIRYVRLEHNVLLLRPQSQRAEVELLPVAPGSEATDLIIGRVAHISMEI